MAMAVQDDMYEWLHASGAKLRVSYRSIVVYMYYCVLHMTYIYSVYFTIYVAY